MLDSTQKKYVSTCVKDLFKDVEAIYLFGSQADQSATPTSDIDLAILVREKPDPELAFQLKSRIAAQLQRDVDLVDLYRADTVTQAQVVAHGMLLSCGDPTQVAFYETHVLSAYANLNLERAEIIQSIKKRGKILD